MIERLWRAFTVLYWAMVMILVPIIAARGLYTACQRKKKSTDKHEQRFWNNEILLNSCLLYGVVVIYYHLFQDVLFLPFGLQAQADFTRYFELVMGLPAAIWYAYTDRKLLASGDPLTFLTPTFFGVFVVFIGSFALSYFRVFGHKDEDEEWIASAKRCQEIWEQYEREEAPFRALSKQIFEHHKNHPRNHGAWSDLSSEQQENLEAKWEERLVKIEEERAACPRASHFNKSK